MGELTTRQDRYREKMVRGLVRALDDEESHLRRYRRVGHACSVLGAVMLALTLSAAWGGADGAGPWYVMAGAVGGLSLGLAVFFHSSVEQWPVNREFLDVAALREAARRMTQAGVSGAAAPRDQIIGTWRMLSWKRTLVDTGEERDALGPDPFGYINYAPDGRLMVFVLRSGRPRPTASPPTPEEKIALYDSLFAYVGSYKVEQDRVVHTLDGSWNELWTGTTQTRLLSFDQGRLVYTTPETVDPMDGQRCTYRVEFERA